jgi:hypothetical protein
MLEWTVTATTPRLFQILISRVLFCIVHETDGDTNGIYFKKELIILDAGDAPISVDTTARSDNVLKQTNTLFPAASVTSAL